MSLHSMGTGRVVLGLICIGGLGGCVAGGGYGADYNTGGYIGYGVDYYDAPGYVYGGGWTSGYRVGPPRRGGWGHGPNRPGYPGAGPRPIRPGGGYRAPPATRPMPSIPTTPRGGGHFGGGGHPGGGAGPRR
jgi:hypothetical protein